MDNIKIRNLLTDIENMAEISKDYIKMHKDEQTLQFKLQFTIDVIESAIKIMKTELKK